MLAVYLMAAKLGIPVCPHAGGVGLCNMVPHLQVQIAKCICLNCKNAFLKIAKCICLSSSLPYLRRLILCVCLGVLRIVWWNGLTIFTSISSARQKWRMGGVWKMSFGWSWVQVCDAFGRWLQYRVCGGILGRSHLPNWKVISQNYHHYITFTFTWMEGNLGKGAEIIP